MTRRRRPVSKLRPSIYYRDGYQEARAEGADWPKEFLLAHIWFHQVNACGPHFEWSWGAADAMADILIERKAVPEWRP